FGDVARSGNVRADGKLLVAGDDSGLIQVFDINTRAVLRTMKDHNQPVHVTRFSPLDTTQLLSCSDDTTVKLWDIPSQRPTVTFHSHTDYVRSGVFSSSNPSLILTGGYDGSLHLLDSRTGQSSLHFPGSTPVEDVLLFPSSTVALSAGGPILKAKRVLTGGLDQLVKVYDVNTYRVVHTMRYSAPLLCLAVSPDDTHIAAGMSDGTLSVRHRTSGKPQAPAPTTFDAHLDTIGNDDTPLPSHPQKLRGDPHELQHVQHQRKKLRPYDRLLKKFRYADAMDAVLKPGMAPEVTFSILEKIRDTQGLQLAINGRDDLTLAPLLTFLHRHLADTTFGPFACEVAGVVVETYASVIGLSPLIDNLLIKLQNRIAAELRFQCEVRRLQGALEMLMAASTLNGVTPVELPPLPPPPPDAAESEEEAEEEEFTALAAPRPRKKKSKRSGKLPQPDAAKPDADSPKKKPNPSDRTTKKKKPKTSKPKRVPKDLSPVA
ncbi:hypothetical protein FRB99_003943, partial [Tulasnella sp. 403]